MQRIESKRLVPSRRSNKVSARIHRRRRCVAALTVMPVMVSAGLMQAPWAAADSVSNFKNAVAGARGGGSCAPLRDNPLAEKAAEISNRSLEDYLNHIATRVPVEDPLPGLKDLGYPGRKAKLLSGAGHNDADAIKGALLEGFAVYPDCSYTDFGVSIRLNAKTGYYISSLIVAGS